MEQPALGPPQGEAILGKLDRILARLDAIEGQWRGMELQRKEMLNTEEAAAFLSLSRSHIYKLCSEREIPHHKQGNRTYFRREELEEWMAGERIKTVHELQLEAMRDNIDRELEKMKR